jgi:hypothetical protein
MAEKPNRTHKFRKSGGLTAAARQSLPKSDFALPGKGEVRHKVHAKFPNIGKSQKGARGRYGAKTVRKG